MLFLYEHSQDREALQGNRQQHAKDLHGYFGKEWANLSEREKHAVREHEMAILGFDRIEASKALQATEELTEVDRGRLVHFAKVAREYGKSDDIPDDYAVDLVNMAKTIFVRYPEKPPHSTKPPSARALGKGNRQVTYSSGLTPPAVRRKVDLDMGAVPSESDVLDVLPYSPRVLTPDEERRVSNALAGQEDQSQLFTAESLQENQEKPKYTGPVPPVRRPRTK
jgi:hypothetical protein